MYLVCVDPLNKTFISKFASILTYASECKTSTNDADDEHNVTTIDDTPLPFKSQVNVKTRFLAGGCSKNRVNTTHVFNAKN
jgi:hypothetical protein